MNVAPCNLIRMRTISPNFNPSSEFFQHFPNAFETGSDSSEFLKRAYRVFWARMGVGDSRKAEALHQRRRNIVK